MRALLCLLMLVLPFAAKESPEEILALLPAKFAGCEKTEYHAYEPAGLGGSVSYKVPGLVVTVYAYDLGKENITGKLDDPTIREAFDKACADLGTALEQGIYSEVTEQKPEDRRSAFGTLRAVYRVVRAKGPDAGVPLFSEIHAFGAHGHIIKFRVSGEIEGEKELRKILDELLPKIRATLAPDMKKPAPKAK